LILLGIGLLVLWLVGLGERSAGWLLWLNFIVGVLSIVGGLTISEGMARGARVGEPTLLSLALFVFWIVALATSVASWKTWWTFAFACAYGLLAISGTSETAMRRRRPISA
jgi:hypothetical protein